MRKTGLLVSVRNQDEAVIAERAGADLIDLKEPGRGPLGRSDESVWTHVRGRVAGNRLLSAALGEWGEWEACGDAEIRQILAKLEGFHFAKIGPADSVDDAGGGLERTYSKLKSLGPMDLKWIAVVYADQESGCALPRHRILDIAIRCGFDGVLIDTFDKSKPHFWDGKWDRFVRSVKEKGLFVALAGGIDTRIVKRLASWDPDWLAVRGAACRGGERSGQVSYRKVRRLLERLEQNDSIRSDFTGIRR
jgi:uncharacterized protein (UPF0264 family)